MPVAVSVGVAVGVFVGLVVGVLVGVFVAVLVGVAVLFGVGVFTDEHSGDPAAQCPPDPFTVVQPKELAAGQPDVGTSQWKFAAQPV